MIDWRRTKPMTEENAVLIIKWGCYLRPTPTNAEENEAWRILKNMKPTPDLRWSK